MTHHPSPTSRAFTLIELLIVVAIISVLAAIAVPNFLHAQVRAKLAHCQENMRTVATALEAYCVDYLAYPPERGPHLSSDDGMAQLLTTPVPYLKSLPVNHFVTQEDWNRQHWWQYGLAPAGDGWCLESPGADLVESLPEARFYLETLATSRFAYILGSYDPSNGLRSSGDIVRFGP
ncbi:prepilin-type N-terminal cleavage/methylation domain-containing protein [bacterium]|nr:prepilin-type N-terminal cleavage/methylation domain-containing protein [bacterium]